MGLINYLQDEEERTIRRAGQMQDQFGRRINKQNGLVSAYNKESADTQSTFKPYQDKVQAYNDVYSAFDSNRLQYNGQNVYVKTVTGERGATWKEYYADNGTNRPTALTIRAGTPFGNQLTGGEYVGYSSNEYKPMAKVGLSDPYALQSGAQEANTWLEGQKVVVDGLNAKSAGLTASNASLERRGDIVERKAGREAERLQNEILLNERRAREEAAVAQSATGSVLDQNSSGVFTSISDWLKG